MIFAKKMIFFTLLTVAASLTAAAQDRVLKFKLAQVAHIGSAVLPAGDYRMTLYSDTRIMTVVSPEDRRGAAVIALPISYETSNSCSKASVTLTPNGKELDLTSVCFGSNEIALHFRTVRSKATTQAAIQTTDATALAGAQ